MLKCSSLQCSTFMISCANFNMATVVPIRHSSYIPTGSDEVCFNFFINGELQNRCAAVTRSALTSYQACAAPATWPMWWLLSVLNVHCSTINFWTVRESTCTLKILHRFSPKFFRFCQSHVLLWTRYAVIGRTWRHWMLLTEHSIGAQTSSHSHHTGGLS